MILPHAFDPWSAGQKLHARTTLAGCMGILMALQAAYPKLNLQDDIAELREVLGIKEPEHEPNG